MDSNFSDVLKNWIPEALDGNVEYFKQLKNQRILDRCKDGYGMTPLMYAVLGKGCLDRELLSEFVKLCKKTDQNCLGHTACDIYICIASPAVFNRESFDVLDPSSTMNKARNAYTSNDTGLLGLLGDLLGIGLTGMATYNYMKADSAQRANMDAAFQRNAAQARISSNKSLPNLNDTIAEIEKNISKIRTEQFNRLIHLGDRLNAKEKELKRLQAELENLDQNGAEVLFQERCQKYKDEQYQRLLHTVQKDEFETQAEFQQRIVRMMWEEHGPEIREEDLLMLRTQAEKALDQRRQEIVLKLSDYKRDVRTLELQSELRDIYAFPFSNAYISLGAYDAESECFPLIIGRYATLIHVPRETAKIMRQDSDSYTVRYDYDRKNLSYHAKVIIQTADQTFASEDIECRLLARGGNTKVKWGG